MIRLSIAEDRPKGLDLTEVLLETGICKEDVQEGLVALAHLHLYPEFMEEVPQMKALAGITLAMNRLFQISNQ